MDAVLLLVIGLAAIAAGCAARSLRPLIAGGAAFVGGLGIIRATFAAIAAEPAVVAVWLVVAIAGLGAFAAELAAARRRSRV